MKKLLSLIILAMLVIPAQAQVNSIWTGAGNANGNWTPGNWSAGMPNGIGDVAIFNAATGNRTITNNVTGDLILGSLWFQGTLATPPTFTTTVSGGVIRFSNGGNSFLKISEAHNVTIASAIVLDDMFTIDSGVDIVGRANTLIISGNITTNGNVINMISGNPQGVTRISGAIIGAATALNKSGAGTLTLTNGNSTFGGGLNITLGTVTGSIGTVAGAGITIGAVQSGQNQLGTGNINVQYGSLLQINTGAANQFVDLAGNTLSFAASRVQFNGAHTGAVFKMSGGTLSANATGTLQLTNASFYYQAGTLTGAPNLWFDMTTAAAQTFSGDAVAMSGWGNITKTGTALLTIDSLTSLSAANFFLQAGNLTLNTNLALSGALNIGNSVTPFFSTVTLGLNNAYTGAINVLPGTGIQANANWARFNIGGNSQNIGAVTLGANSFISFHMTPSAGSTLNFTSPVTGVMHIFGHEGNTISGVVPLSQLWYYGFQQGAAPTSTNFLTATYNANNGWWDYRSWNSGTNVTGIEIPNYAGASAIIPSMAVDINSGLTPITLGHLSLGPSGRGGVRRSLTGVQIFDSGIAGQNATLTATGGPDSLGLGGTMVLNSNLEFFGYDTGNGNLGIFSYITGSGEIIVQQGTLMLLDSANDFTGGVTINNGVRFFLATGDKVNTVLGSGTFTINGGAIFGNNNTSSVPGASIKPQIVNALLINGNFQVEDVEFTYAGDVELTATRTITVSRKYNPDLASVTFSENTNLVGVGGLIKEGNQSLELLSGSNTFQGGLFVNAGQVYTTIGAGGLVIGALAPGKNYLGSGSIQITGVTSFATGYGVYVDLDGNDADIDGLVNVNEWGFLRFFNGGTVNLNATGTIHSLSTQTLGDVNLRRGGVAIGDGVTVKNNGVTWTGGANLIFNNTVADAFFTGNALSGIGVLGINASGTGYVRADFQTTTLWATTWGTLVIDAGVIGTATTIRAENSGVILLAGNNVIGTNTTVALLTGGRLAAAASTTNSLLGQLSLLGNASIFLQNDAVLRFTGATTVGTTSGVARWEPSFQLNIGNETGLWNTLDASSAVIHVSNNRIFVSTTSQFTAQHLQAIAFTGYKKGAMFISDDGVSNWYLAPSSTQISEWTGNPGMLFTGTTWLIDANWVNDHPDAVGRVAGFRDIDQNLDGKEIEVDGNFTIGEIEFSSGGGQKFSIIGPGSLTFNNGAAGNSLIQIFNNSSPTLSADLVLVNNLEIRHAGTGTFSLLSHITDGGSGKAVIQTGFGVVFISGDGGPGTSDFTGGYWMRGSAATAASGTNQPKLIIASDGLLFGMGSYDGVSAASSTQALNIGDGTPGRWYTVRVDSGTRTVEASVRIAGNIYYGSPDGSAEAKTLAFSSPDPSYITAGTWSLAGRHEGLYSYNTLEFHGDMEGEGTFRLNNYAAVTFYGTNNTFSGGIITDDNARLLAGADNALGSGTLYFNSTGASSLRIGSVGGAWSLQNEIVFNQGYRIFFTGTTTFSSSGTSVLMQMTEIGGFSTLDGSTHLLVFSSDHELTGTGGLYVGPDQSNYGGTLRLEGSNSYTGNTILHFNNTLEVGNNHALGSGTIVFNRYDSNVSWLASYGGPITLSNPLQFTSEYAKLNGLAGLLTLDPAFGSVLNAQKRFQITGSAAFGSNLALDGPGGFTMTGGGVLTLTCGTSTYTGTTSVEHGTLRVSATGNITIGRMQTGENYLGTGKINFTTMASTRLLELVTKSTGTVTFASDLALNGQNATWLSKINVTDTVGDVTGSAIVTRLDGTFAITGNIYGSLNTPGDILLTDTSTITWTGGVLSSSNNFLIEGLLNWGGNATTRATLGGTMVVQGGTLNLGNAGIGLTNNTALRLDLGDGATMKLNGLTHSLNQTVLSLSGNATIDMANTGIVTFQTVNATAWSGTLTVENWKGNVTGGGASQLRFTQNVASVFDTSHLKNMNFYYTTAADLSPLIMYVSGARVVNPSVGIYELVPLGAGAEWDGDTGGSNWNNQINWVGDSVVPNGQANVAKFGDRDPNLNGKSIINDAPNLTLGGLVLANGTATFSIGGAGLRMDFGADEAFIDVQDANNVTLLGDMPITLLSNLSIMHTSSGTLTIQGVISGNKGVTKNGWGLLVLTAANTYTGGFKLLDGEVRFTNNQAFGTGTLTLTGGTLTAAGAARTATNAYVVNGTTALGGFDLTLSGSGNVTGGELVVSNTTTLSGVVGGTGNLTKSGTGTMLLTNTNTISGGITITDGIVGINNDRALGTGTLGFEGGTLRMDAAALTATNNVNLISGTGTVNTNGNNATLSGTISGDGDLAKVGSGTLTISGSNTHTGTTHVDAGTVVATNQSAFGTGTLDNMALVQLAFSNGTLANDVTGTGTNLVSGSNIRVSGSSDGFTGLWDVSGTSSVLVNNAANLGSGSVALAGLVTVDGANDFTFDNVVTGTGRLQFMATGINQFQSAAGFAGIVEAGGGTFIWDTDSSTALTSATLEVTGGLLVVDSGTQTALGFTMNGGTTAFTGTAKVTNFTISGSSNVVFDPSAMGTVALLRQDEGGGQTLVIATGVTSGNVADLHLVTAAGVTVGTSSTLSVAGGGGALATDTNAWGIYSNTLALTGGTLSVNWQLEELQLIAGKTLVLDYDTTALPTGGDNMNALISGLGNLAIQATNAITLGAVNTFTGTTTITGGTLRGSVANIIAQSDALVIGNNTVFDLSGGNGLGGFNQQVKNLTGSGEVKTGTNVLTVESTRSSTYGGVISGSGKLTKIGAAELVLSASNNYSGGTDITAGTLTLANLQGAGSGTVNNVAVLNLAGSGTYANATIGTGTNIIAGTMAITGNNSPFVGTWQVTGSGLMTAQTQAGQSGAAGAIVNMAGGVLEWNSMSGFNQRLTGNSGNLLINNGGAFGFGADVGSAYSGTVTLSSTYAGGSVFALSSNTAALVNATLVVGDNNTTVVGSGTQHIGNLTLTSGTIAFTAGTGNRAESFITTDTLTMGNSIVMVDISALTGGALPILQQDEGSGIQLVAANTVSGGGTLDPSQLVDQDGNQLGNATAQTLAQTTGTAEGTYNFVGFAGINTSGTGLFLNYSLIELALQTGTFFLTGDVVPPAGGNDMTAKITGAGDLGITATGTIILKNTNNDYTGKTIVTSGVLLVGVNNALGQTSELIINSGATANIGGTTGGGVSQTVNGMLLNSGTLNLSSGSLAISGGTSTGSLIGSGTLTNTSGLFNVIGANNTFTATVNNSGTVRVNDVAGIGASGTLNNTGLFELSAATGTITKQIAGNGLVSATNGANVILGGDNSGMNGGWIINAANRLKAIAQNSLGSGTVNNSGTLALGAATALDTGTWMLNPANVISGAGVVVKEDANTVVIGHSNNYTGNTYVNQGTLRLTAVNAIGSGTADVTSLLDLALTGTYANNTIGSGTAKVSGTVAITGTNSVAHWWITGSGGVTRQHNLGSGDVNLDGGELGISGTSAWHFTNEVYGSGTIGVNLTSASGTFSFDPSAASANTFNGAVDMRTGRFQLDNTSAGMNAGSGTGVMKDATLILSANGSTLVDSGTYYLGGLTFNGGTLMVEMEDATRPKSILTVGDLHAPAASKLALDQWNKVAVPMPDGADFFYHDEGEVLQQIVKATGNVSDVDAQLDIYDFDGVLITDATKKSIVDTTGTSGTATYDYGARVVDSGTDRGIYLAYMLRELSANSGTQVILSNSGTLDPNNRLTAKLTGEGGFIMSGTGVYAIGAANSDYKGATNVVSGTVRLYANNGFGNTSLLDLAANTGVDMGGATAGTGVSQTVGALSGSAGSTLTFNGGTLTISGTTGNSQMDGALTDGTLAGGALIVQSNTLTVTSTNAGLTASGTIASAGAMVLNDVASFGTGTITANGRLVFNGATGTNANSIGGSGTVSTVSSANVTLGGNNSAFVGNWLINAGTRMKATSANSLGSGSVNVTGTLALGGTTPTDSNAWTMTPGNVLTGAGKLVKEDANNVTINGTNTGFTGNTDITGGTLTLGGDLRGVGTAGTVANASVLNLAGSGTYQNATTGSGTNIIAGTMSITGNNSGFDGTWQVSGSGKMTAQTQMGVVGAGGAKVRMDGGTLEWNGVNLFNQQLTGTSGRLLVVGNGAFDFGGAVGSAYSGTVSLQGVSFLLDGLNTASLTNATLSVETNSAVTVGTSVPVQNIGNLTLQSGTMIFTLAASGTAAVSIVATDVLDIGSTVVVVNTVAMGTNNLPILQQDDDWVPIQLVSATTVTGNAAFTVVDQSGNALGSGTTERTLGLTQTTGSATGTYDFRAVASTARGGMWLDYILTALELTSGTFFLNGDVVNGTGGDELHVVISGTGNLGIEATGTITLNGASTYTGQTLVTQGVLLLGVNNALGQTTGLTINGGATADMGGKTQTVNGMLLNSGTLMVGSGSLAVKGGTSTGIITGSANGTLNNLSGLLDISGSNGSFNSSIINSGTLRLNHIASAGTSGTITNNDLVILNAVSGTLTKAISGAGNVDLIGSDVTLTATNAVSGTWNINNASRMVASGSANVGTGDIVISGTFVADNGGEWIITNVLTGTGELIKQNTGNLVFNGSNNRSGLTTISGGTITLNNLGGIGSGNVTNNSVLDLAGTGTFANNISGNSTAVNKITGNGVVVSGSNTAFSGTWSVVGSGTVSKQDNLGSTSKVDIANGGHLTLDTTASGNFDWINALTGSGTLTVDLTGTADKFTFAASTGAAFAGTVELLNNSFTIDADAEAALGNATLQVGNGNLTDIATSASGSRSIGGLIFDGGTLKFAPYDPFATKADTIISTGDLTLNSGTVIVTMPDPAQIPDGNAFTGTPLLQQDEGMILTQLIAAGGVVSGNAQNITLTDGTNELSAAYELNISHDGVTADAIGTYDYIASTSTNNDGLYVAYGLKAVEILANRTLILDQDTTAVAGGNDFKAQINGVGDLEIRATESIILNGTNNTYTGKTLVTSGTLIGGAEDVIATSSALVLYDTVFDLGGLNQTVQHLSGTGSVISDDNGILTLSNTAASVFTGDVTGVEGLVKTGNGDFTLIGNATVAGDTFMVLQGEGNVTLTDGTLALGGGTTWFDDQRASGTLTLANMAEVVGGSDAMLYQASGATALVLVSSTAEGAIAASSATLDINADSQWNMTEDSALGGLNNYGLVDIASEGGFKVLTINGDLGGSGTFGMNVSLANMEADKIVVSGVLSGVHEILIKRDPATDFTTERQFSLLLIESGSNMADVSGSTEFKGSVAMGMKVAKVQAGDFNGDNLNNWYLTYDYRDDEIGDTGKAVYGAAVHLMWFTQMDSLLKRMGELRNQSLPAVAGPGPVGGGKKDIMPPQYIDSGNGSAWLNNVWVRGYGSGNTIDKRVIGSAFDLKIYGTDLGTDRAWALDEDNILYTGVFGGFAGDRKDYRSHGTKGETDSYYGGIYATWINAEGWYADLVGKAQYFRNSFTAWDESYNRTDGRYNNWAFGASLETGKQIRLRNGWFAEPQAQVIWMHGTKADYRTTGANPVAITAKSSDALQFRLGSLLGKTYQLESEGAFLQPYVKINALEYVSLGGEVIGSNARRRINLDGAAISVGAGIIWQIDLSNQLYFDYEAVQGQSYRTPWALNLGFRRQF